MGPEALAPLSSQWKGDDILEEIGVPGQYIAMSSGCPAQGGQAVSRPLRSGAVLRLWVLSSHFTYKRTVPASLSLDGLSWEKQLESIRASPHTVFGAWPQF